MSLVPAAERWLNYRVALLGLAVLAAALIATFAPNARAAATPPHVMIVLMENTSYEGIVGNTQMPYVNGLIAANGSVSTTDLSHPSLPNYLGLVSGSIQDDPQDTTPQDGTYSGLQFTDELAAAGISWKAYMQDMPVACDLIDQFSPGSYDVNHNPFMYFNSVRNTPSQCNSDVPYPQLTTDLNAGTAPPFLWVTPNTTNDMHDGTPAQGDAFLQGLVTQVEASSWWTPGSRIVITWDEGTQSEQVLTLVVGSAHGTAANGGNEYGTLRGLEEAYGVGLLGGSANAANGDILPLLTGAAAPPSPGPSPSPSPSTPPSPSPSPSASPSPSPSPVPGPASGTRGITRYTSTDFAAMRAAGFNAATDGGVQDNGAAEAANGITGSVWVDAYNNSNCTQTLTNSAIAAMVQANVSAGNTGLRYEIGDEPTANGCNAAPVYTSITQAVHAVDPTAKTWTMDDQFQTGNPIQQGVPMKGSLDILAFDVYPCESGPCDYAAIDSAVQQIHAAGVTNWEFVIQDFSASPWRWPTPTEIQTQFDHWKNSGAIGYWVFAWDYLGQQVIQQPGNVAALQSINSQAINGSTLPSPSPSPLPSPSPSPSPSPPTPPLSAGANASPTSGNAPVAVSFTSTATGGVSPYTYAWTFGDGATASTQNPGHTYTAAGSYTATVTVTDSRGVTTQALAGPITVRSTLAAAAVASPSSGDASLTVSFTGSATGGLSPYTYSWVFGDGSTSTTQSPSHVYAVAGTYNAVITVTDAGGATASATAAVSVAASPGAAASGSPSMGDPPLVVAFTSTVSGGTAPFTFAWTFGDGGTAGTRDADHTYTAVGTYNAQVTVIDAVGHISSATVVITVNAAPTAIASGSPTLGDAPLAVNFAGSAASGTPPYGYAWTFGDGATSNNQSPSHTYTTAGTFSAQLTVTDAAGHGASTTVSITVNPSLAASAVASPTTGNVPFAVLFTGSASGGQAPYAYAWSFGDGGTSTSQNPGHTYSSAGTYTATLTVTDALGVKATASTGTITVHGPLAALAGGSPATGDAPLDVAFTGLATGGTLPYTYVWDFGDGGTGSGQSPSHTYTSAGTFAATLTITDGANDSAVATVAVAVSPGLSITGSAAPLTGSVPLAVSFTSTPTGGKGPYSFAWAFGDGANSPVQNPGHTYALPGTFNATVTVTDANGASATAMAGPITASRPLAASAAAMPDAGDAPLGVALTGTATGGTSPYTYTWSFGDGTTGSGQNPGHAYTSAGDYVATLTVNDAANNTATATVSVAVSPSLGASSSASSAGGTAPLAVGFTGTPTGGKAPYTFAWAFGDGATSTSQNPSHMYSLPGTFSATLTITDANGVTASASPVSVSVAPGPLLVTAATTRSLGDAPLSTTLTSSVTGGTPPFTYSWNLGDGASSTSGQPNHTYASAGDFTATLTVTDSRGITAQATASITVYDALNITVSATPIAGGAPLPVAFTAVSTGGLAPYVYFWSFGDGASSTGAATAHSYGSGSFSPTLTVHDAAGGTWTGIVATITSTAPNAPPANISGGGTRAGGSGPGAVATPTPTEPTPTAEPSASPQASPQASPVAPAASSTSSNGTGSIPGGNASLVLMLAGSVLAAGCGGWLFVGWRRRRLL